MQLERTGKIENLTCLELLNELDDKLRSKMGLTPAEATRAVAEILSFPQLVKIETKLPVVIADPDDDKILECAIAGKADFIVSGDRHLLDLENYQGIPILRASTLIEQVTME